MSCYGERKTDLAVARLASSCGKLAKVLMKEISAVSQLVVIFSCRLVVCFTEMADIVLSLSKIQISEKFKFLTSKGLVTQLQSTIAKTYKTN